MARGSWLVTRVKACKSVTCRLAFRLQLPGDPNPGELYPLWTQLTHFDRFGTDISQYMHFTYWSCLLFALTLVLSAPEAGAFPHWSTRH